MLVPSPDTVVSTLPSRILFCANRLGGKRRLADAAGMSEAQIFRYVNGESDAPATKLLAIAHAARVCPGWLLGGTGTPDAGAPVQAQRPEYRPTLMAAVVKAFTEALTEYDVRLTPLQRSRFLSFAYEVLRHEEVLLKRLLTPNRGDILEMLYYLGRESFDELLGLHEQAYQGAELGLHAENQTTEWHEHFTNAVRLGYTNAYGSAYGAAFYRRLGHAISEQSRDRLLGLLSTIRSHFNGRKNIGFLDVGCGNGREIQLLAKHQPDFAFHGLDVSSIALAEIGKLAKTGLLNAENFSESDMRLIPWPDASFEVVYSRMGLHCLPHISGNHGVAEAVAEMGRVCKPGGLVCLSTAHGSGRLYLPLVQYLGLEELQDILQKNGLTLLSHYTEVLDNGTFQLRAQIHLVASKA